MSARRPDMHRLQELVRLHRMGQSARSLARQLRMGRATALQYLAAFREGEGSSRATRTTCRRPTHWLRGSRRSRRDPVAQLRPGGRDRGCNDEGPAASMKRRALRLDIPGDDLLSQRSANTIGSDCVTTVFEMGTGMASPISSPGVFVSDGSWVSLARGPMSRGRIPPREEGRRKVVKPIGRLVPVS